MKIIPRRPFTWLLIAFVIYSYISIKGEPTKDEDEAHNKKPVVVIDSATNQPGEGDKPIDVIVKKISETKTGQVVVRALVEDAIKEKYGDKDVSTVAAQESGKLMTLDLLKGDGPVVVCGSQVTIDYDSFTDVKLPLDSTKDKQPITFKVGNGQVIKGLENGVVGMQAGGKRKIAIPSRLAYDNLAFKSDLASDSPVSFDVQMLDVKDGITTTTIMQIDNVVGGIGDKEVLCGSDVSLTYKQIQNEVEVASGSLVFRVGNGNVPVGLEKAVLEMRVGAVRKLSIPKEMQAIIGQSILPQDIKLPDDGDLVLLVKLVAIN